MSAADVDRLAARADLARLLAACYYEPGPALAEERVFEAIAAAAERVDEALGDAARALGAAYAAADPQELLVDYTRLFLGPVQTRARPYGSVWLDVDGGVMQDSTMAVAALYKEGGFEIADDFRDLPDHVAAELEFLYLLLFKAAQAAALADHQASGAVCSLRARFLREHLGAWIGPFAAAVRSGAETGFYRALAGLTDAFVGREAAACGA